MRTKRLLLLSLPFVLACKPPTPAEQMDSILSWIGTAGMAADAWLRHTTPDAYTRQTLELSSTTLGQISNELLESPFLAVDTVALDRLLTGSRRRVARMADLVKGKNAPAVARTLDSLRTDQKNIKAFADSIESSQ
jgi:hypothetical protein